MVIRKETSRYHKGNGALSSRILVNAVVVVEAPRGTRELGCIPLDLQRNATLGAAIRAEVE